jgi:hypothetical protein
MYSLGLLGILFGYIAWQLLFLSIVLAHWAWWLPFCVVVFLGMIAFALAWRTLQLASLVALKLTTKRLAWRDFKNSLADWLVASNTGFKD